MRRTLFAVVYTLVSLSVATWGQDGGAWSVFAPGGIRRVSTGNHFTESDCNSGGGRISADGRFVAFYSCSAFVPNIPQNSVSEFYLRDTCLGAPGCLPTTRRASVAPDGTDLLVAPHLRANLPPAISADGRYVSFLYGDFPFFGPQGLFFRDNCNGTQNCATKVIQLATKSGLGTFYSLVMSGDGGFLAYGDMFQSLGGNGQRVVTYTTCLGDLSNCSPVESGVGLASNPVLSADGRYLAVLGQPFSAGAPRPPDRIVDTCYGGPAGCVQTATTINFGMPLGVSIVAPWAMSAGPRYFAVAKGTPSQIYLEDSCFGVSGGCTPQEVLVSATPLGTPSSGDSASPSISGDGRYVAFASSATDLTSDATGAQIQVFVRDTCLGASPECVPRTVLVTRDLHGVAGDGTSSDPAITNDGRYLAFTSAATNLVPHDTNGVDDVFVADLAIIFQTPKS